MGVHLVLAASSWPFAVLLAVPVLIALFPAAFKLADNSRQRVANLLLGTLCSVALLVALVVYIEGTKDPWLEDCIPFFAPIAMSVGAAAGVALAVLVRRFFSATH